MWILQPRRNKDNGDIDDRVKDDEDLGATLAAARKAARREGVTRALVLVPDLSRHAKPGSAAAKASLHSPEDRLAETQGLAEAIDLTVAKGLVVSLSSPKPATLFGSGKVEELGALVTEEAAELVIIDHAVSPVQQRNLEMAWKAKVLDRTGLILEIFGRRARTREGRLQVELAHLTYQKGRLVRAWTHLERQRGGRGFLGGPGEAQLELDRRLLQDRIDAIRKDLTGVVRTRELHRAGRRKVPYPIVAIVGYTNAGKSTLFNRVTGADVLAKDQVFATLDPTMREVKLKSGRRIILSDTVGFISDLPTMLVAAFRATLEEVIEADLILHVRDISHAETDAQAKDVETVLDGLGIDTVPADNHILEVWNKVDLLSTFTREEAMASARWQDRHPALVSATTGEGIGALLEAIDARLGKLDEMLAVTVPSTEGRLINWLHENTDVIETVADDGGAINFRVRVASEMKQRLLGQLKKAGVAIE